MKYKHDSAIEIRYGDEYLYRIELREGHPHPLRIMALGCEPEFPLTPDQKRAVRETAIETMTLAIETVKRAMMAEAGAGEGK